MNGRTNAVGSAGVTAPELVTVQVDYMGGGNGSATPRFFYSDGEGGHIAYDEGVSYQVLKNSIVFIWPQQSITDFLTQSGDVTFIGSIDTADDNGVRTLRCCYVYGNCRFYNGYAG